VGCARRVAVARPSEGTTYLSWAVPFLMGIAVLVTGIRLLLSLASRSLGEPIELLLFRSPTLPVALVGSSLFAAWVLWRPKAERSPYFPIYAFAYVFLLALLRAVVGAGASEPDTPRPETIEEFRALAERRPSSERAQQDYAWALLDSGRIREAIPVLERAIELDEDDPYSRGALGWALMQRNRPREAVEHLRIAVQEAPDDAQMQHNLGYALAMIREYEEADAILARASELAPDDLNIATARAEVLAWRDREDEAIAVLRRVVETDSTHARAHDVLGRVYRQRARFAEARAHHERAVQLLPEVTPLWYEVGVSRLFAGAPADALAAFDTVAARDTAFFARSRDARTLRDHARQAAGLDNTSAPRGSRR
jgi:tetratricopeptide (TPR) repeat protein